MQRIRDSHVKPLNDLADRIADAEGLKRGQVPYVDPDQGGLSARMLVLLDNPPTKAEADSGSGLLSLDNNDPLPATAARRTPVTAWTGMTSSTGT